MKNTKIVVAMCAVALALSAAAATPASAATAGWMVNNTMLSGSKAVAKTAAVDASVEIGMMTITIRCSGSTYGSTAAEIVAPNKLAAKSLEFTNCDGIEGACHLWSETVITNPIFVEVTLDGPLATLATLKPQTKSVIATVEFTGESCAVKGQQPVTGSMLILGFTGQDERTIQEVRATASVGELKIGASAVTVGGLALTRLATGEPWSFL